MLKLKSGVEQIAFSMGTTPRFFTPQLWKGLALALAFHLLFFCLFRVTLYTQEEQHPSIAPVRVEVDVVTAPKPPRENPLPALTQIAPLSPPDLPEFPSFVISPLEAELAGRLPEFTEIEKIPYRMFPDDDLR